MLNLFLDTYRGVEHLNVHPNANRASILPISHTFTITTPRYTSARWSFSALQNAQPQIMASLIPTTIQRTLATPAAFDTHPPVIAPTSVDTKATRRRFLFKFLLIPATTIGSETRSHRRLVITTVGTSPTLNARLQTICAALWKLKRPIWRSSDQASPSMTCVWASRAETSTSEACSEKESRRVCRWREPRKAWSREKKRQPMTKQPMDMRERAQPYGLVFWLDAPRATKMVFPGLGVIGNVRLPLSGHSPVCMDTNVL